MYRSTNLEKLRNLRPQRIIICGMGGSGLPGEIINTFKTQLGITSDITIWKDYNLPEAQNAKLKTQNALYIFVSFSGETEETVSGLKAALKIRNTKVLAVTGGGKLLKLAEARRVPLVTFDKDGLAPREASVVMFVGLVNALKSVGVASKVPAIPRRSQDKRAVNLVRFIDKGIPLIYTSHQLKSLAYIWKILLNETAKTPAFTNEFPELDHNEIVGFERRHPLLRAILIEDTTDSERIRTRIAITAKIIKKLGGKAEIIKLRGRSKFERFWNGVYLAQDLAKRLAIKNKVNPKHTKSVDILKAWLKKR